jgi:FixJ family two-component response regulator
MTVRAMKAGAVEFLTKPFHDIDLLDAIHTAIERDRGRREEAASLDMLRLRYGQLTAREREVMALVAGGLANKQVAAGLRVSEVTVKVHRGQVMRKMRARSLPDLVRMGDGRDTKVVGVAHCGAMALPALPAYLASKASLEISCATSRS